MLLTGRLHHYSLFTDYVLVPAGLTGNKLMNYPGHKRFFLDFHHL